MARVPRFADLPRVSDELTPGDRIRVACDLSDAAIALVRARLRRERPTAREAEINRLVNEWLATRPGAEDGDGEGRRVTWPRTHARVRSE
jgi:hypothetical protein